MTEEPILAESRKCGHLRTVIDRYMLYVGCARAMHKLTLTYSGRLTWFLDGRSAPLCAQS
jgi:hypothetical protein